MLDVAITCIDWLNGQERLFIWIRSRFSRPEILHQKFTVREAVEVFFSSAFFDTFDDPTPPF